MKRTVGIVFSIICALASVVAAQSTPSQISLDGTWQFQTDPQRVGFDERWATGTIPFKGHLEVPGVWQAQGVGTPRSYMRNDYVGLGWYRREISVPADWKGKTVILRFGGASRLTKLFVNGIEIGTHDGFSTPFKFDVTDAIRPGAKNVFVVAIDSDWPKSKPVIEGGRDISKPIGFLVYQASWGGMYGHVNLEAHSDPYIDDAYVLPDIKRGIAHVHVNVRSRKASGTYRIAAKIAAPNSQPTPPVTEITIAPGVSQAVTDVPISTVHLWTPEDPFLYQVNLSISSDKTLDEATTKFGMREFRMEGERLLLNGNPYFLRGYGDLDLEPITAIPPVEVDEYVRRFRIAKEYGFNYARLHSRMPSPEMLEAADREGMLISYELPVVYAEFLLPHREFVGKELVRMVSTTRGHPSVFSLDMGNEMDPDRDFTPETRPKMRELLRGFYEQAKKLDPSLIVFGSDGFDIPPSDIASPMRGIVPGKVNLGHEFGGYPCSLPNPKLISKFTGFMVPFWLTDIQNWVKKNGLTEEYPELVRDSERLQWESHKFKIERLRATEHFSGYQLWAITDAPTGVEGGPFEEGVLDYFWDPKSISADRYRQFQADTILLINRKPEERTFWLDHGATAQISVSHFGAPIRNAVLHWRAKDASTGETLDSGSVSNLAAESGTVRKLTDIHFAATNSTNPVHVKVEVELSGEGVHSANEWEFWGYPKNLVPSANAPVVSVLRNSALSKFYPWMKFGWAPSSAPAVVVSSDVTPEVYDFVLGGGKAVVLLDKSNVDVPRDINYFADFVRWSPKAWGTRIEPGAFSSRFVQSGYMDMQFYDLMQDSYGFSEQWLAGAESGRLHPLMWGIRTVPGSLEKMGFVYEFRVGKGSVLLVTLNVERNLDEAHPAALFFFDQALRYVLSADFAPKDELSAQQFSQLAFVAYR